MAYIRSNKDQNWLIPKSIRDMIPNDHICFLVQDFAETLDFSRFDMIYDGAGHPAYHPKIIMKILIQGMLSKIRSSRKLAGACRESFVFMYLAEKVNPDFRTISRFRKDNPKLVKQAFQQTVSLAAKHNLADLSFISIDGSTLKAYAGKRQYFDKKGLDKLDKAIDKMVDDDIALDELEDQLFDDREDGLTGIDRHNLKKIVREYNLAKDKKKIKKNVKKAKNELEKYSLKKVSISDPESRMMQTKKLFSELSYSTQLSVSKDQIIVANDVCQDKHDAHQFIPQMNHIKENVSLRDDSKVALDCGYSDGQNFKFAEDKNIDLYVPSRAQAQQLEGKKQTLNHDQYDYDLKKDEIFYKGKIFRHRGFYFKKNTTKKILIYKSSDGTKKDVPEFFRERLRMKEKMEKPESKVLYNLRKITVEPVYGHLKQNLGFREFLLRGLEKVKIEFNLVCIAHNLQKIWRLRAAQGF
ncbi:MAG: IS1182 family transposase [Thaumarchaeota archaeon]|nr:IS1182 family transposase [Nitrososphaerota archaeon]